MRAFPLAVLLATACASQEQAPQAHEPPPPASAPVAAPQTAAAAPSAVASGGGREPRPSQPETRPDPGRRVYARARFVWINEQPAAGTMWIGYLWSGGSVRLKESKPRFGPGCVEWWAVEPRGFVCVDGEHATLDADDPVVKLVAEHAARIDTPWPHRYAESRGVELYETLPTAAEQRAREWDLEAHRERIAAAARGDVHELVRGIDVTPATESPFPLLGLPPTAHEQRDRLKPLSTVAYSREVLHEGRSFLLTADLLWVPKDRVVPYPKVTFHGVKLGTDAKLPLAFFRTQDRPQYELREGKLVPTEAVFPRLSFVELTGVERVEDDAKYLEARGGRWVKASDAVVPVLRERTPWGAPVGQPDTSGKAPPGRATWLEASVWSGWLLAYEGTRPVYATMISPGRGGTPVPGKDPLETASTPVGSFKITGKFATATMVAPHEFTHSDVPWTQNFSGPHALHGAYWHDDWGNRKSAGCVNVSPIDGKWLYEFTEPTVPEGWHGLRWQPEIDPATTFIVGK